MKVWIDISNSPQVHFFKNIIKRLEKEGYKVVVTARRFGSIEDMLTQLEIRYRIVGEHGGSSKEGKLLCSSKRILELAKFVLEEKPDVALYKHSVEAPRVAYGLGIPSLCVIDNEKAEAQNKLMLPISERIILPKAIEKKSIMEFGVRDEQIRHFDGFCELAHIEEFIPHCEVLNELKLDEDMPIAILRPEPVMANYFHGDPRTSIIVSLLPYLEDFQCVVFPRCKAQEDIFRNTSAIIPSRCVDALSLISFSDVVISAGGSMNREAVAMCKPAISTYPEKLLAITEAMVCQGIKMHSLDVPVINNYVEVLFRNRGYERFIKEKIKNMENPIDVIIEELEKM
ncbi:MAG: DUF354 domain-containing protein [Candidatus Methanofastidiosia archaeon]